MEREREEREGGERKRESESEGESRRRLKHTGAEIRFGFNDIMLLTRFGLLVAAQHKFH